MEKREKEFFDEYSIIDNFDGIKRYNAPPATNSDRTVWWITGGASDGARIRLLWEKDFEELYVAPYLHPVCMVKASWEDKEKAKCLLLRLANRFGGEFRRLVPILQVPGFEEGRYLEIEKGRTYFDGYTWYTRSEYALELPCPQWADGNPRVYDLAEGVYVFWERGDIRLISRKDYYKMDGEGWSPPVFRQGDLFILRAGCFAREAAFAEMIAATAPQEPIKKSNCQVDDYKIGKHHIKGEVFVRSKEEEVFIRAGSKIQHPEHEDVEISEPGFGGSTWYRARILPGSSRPFSGNSKAA